MIFPKIKLTYDGKLKHHKTYILGMIDYNWKRGLIKHFADILDGFENITEIKIYDIH